MKLARSSLISEIDRFAESELGIPTVDLIKRSGDAVARVVADYTPKGSHVIIFAGKGNNGADGYAAACNLMNDYEVTVFDVFGEGQKSAGGKHFLALFAENGGDLRDLAGILQGKAFTPSDARLYSWNGICRAPKYLIKKET